jgi:two-component system, LytTR family, sensor kinase
MIEVQLQNLRQLGRAYLLSIAVWSALSVLTAWEYRIFDQQLNIHSTFLDMLLLAESRGLAFALLTPAVFYLVHHASSRARHFSHTLAIYVAALIPFMVLDSFIRWVILPPWDATLQKYVSRTAYGPFELIREQFADQVTIYIALVLAAHAYQYFNRLRKQELERSEFQRALAASELQVLKMQLHPHFLFNTLHGISTLIDTDRASAKAMLVRLSALLRRSLEYASPDLIPLREEIRFIEEYLALEMMRFGSRLSVTFSVDPDTQSMLVPQLILQPLVENAVRHGIGSSREPGWIEIASSRTPEALELRIRNSVSGNGTRGTGVGLRNTETRLKHLYGDEATLMFNREGNGIATATVVLPVLGVHSHATSAVLN